MKQANKILPKVSRNRNWEYNNALIEKAFFELLEKYKKIPSVREISEVTKLSDTTIDKHLKTLNLDKATRKLKIMTPKILTRLGLEALKTGKSPETKLFLQVVEKFSERHEVTGKDGQELIPIKYIEIPGS